MRLKKNPHQVFENICRSKYDELVIDYDNTIDIARDDFKQQAHNMYRQKIYDNLRLSQNKLKDQSRFFIEIKDQTDANKYLKFESLFNEKILALKNINKTALLQNLSELQAFERLNIYAAKQEKKYIPQIEKKSGKMKSSIKWNGKTETEFIQFVYALFEGGYITNPEKEITTAVKQFAQLLNVELGDHWQSNFSKNINNTKSTYKPQIFKNMEDSFMKYRDRMISKEK